MNRILGFFVGMFFYAAMGSVFLAWMQMLRICYLVAGWAGVIGGVVVSPVTVGIGPWIAGFAYGNWEPLIMSWLIPPVLGAIGMGLAALIKEPAPE